MKKYKVIIIYIIFDDKQKKALESELEKYGLERLGMQNIFALPLEEYRTNYAGIGYVYSPGCWSFNLQAYTVKWSVPRRESQLLGLSGLLTYPVNEKIRLNTFASYSFILSSPFSSSNYGGFVSYDIIPNWGMDFGVRSHTDFPLHKTKTLPIVAPYFQYKGNKLGIDIGGGLFNLLFK